MSLPTDPAPRRILLLAHTGRDDACGVARLFCRDFTDHQIVVRLLEQEARDLQIEAGPWIEVHPGGPDVAADCELAVVIGGDGSILRAAELTHTAGTPMLGVNLGHVGFLAEAEYEDTLSTIDAVIARAYVIEERSTLDVQVLHDGAVLGRTFALNEASVEKAARERMLELVVEIDGRPVSRWGCDGVVCATPTGSTAYNFSAGGPVVWPDVEALLLVPISAHALFARPMVVSPRSVMAVEVLAPAVGSGVLWCDGRRTMDLPAGARIEIRNGATPVRLARLHDAPFADKLVAKFDLPVSGWRGAAARRRAERER